VRQYQVEKYPLAGITKIPFVDVLKAAPKTHKHTRINDRAMSIRAGRFVRNLESKRARMQRNVEITPQAIAQANLIIINKLKTSKQTFCQSKKYRLFLKHSNYRRLLLLQTRPQKQQGR
jgi:hypothetical protein